MNKFVAFLLMFISFLVYGEDCRPISIFEWSGEEMSFSVHSSSPEGRTFLVGVYSGRKLIRTISTGPDGNFTIHRLREGKYLLYIDGLKIADLDVKARSLDPAVFLQQAQEQGAWAHPQRGVYSFRMPDSKTVMVNGNEVRTWGCPSLGFSTN